MKQTNNKLILMAAGFIAVFGYFFADTAKAQPRQFVNGVLTVDLTPQYWATVLKAPGNAYNGVDANGRPTEEQWQEDVNGEKNMFFDNGKMGIIAGDAVSNRDFYLDDWFSKSEIQNLRSRQIIGPSYTESGVTVAFNKIYYHNINPLLNDNGKIPMHRLPFSEPWPKPQFKMLTREHPYKPKNDEGRNPQGTTASFDDSSPLTTFAGQIGFGGAFRVNGRYGYITVGDLALHYDANRPNVNGTDAITGNPAGKPGTDGWYFVNNIGFKDVGAFETANTELTITDNTFTLTGELVFALFWGGNAGGVDVYKAGTFSFVGQLQ
ncbi:hypothetical protein VZ94_16700 [Methylocucumis oryzae]|uniref:Uncharacterized protein n=2 Tax=Methylocucumis oryzae TaxID=1632867 RepID=A0A0F3IJB1_9GAMM|nr:hypothetical protein VZ94_16700 [Methylocucumis oryzae]